MATILLMLMFAAADGFLLYVLFHFGRELKKERVAHAPIRITPVAQARGEQAVEELAFAKVIDITFGSRWSSNNPGRRAASR